jgi:predicted DCC family thiol-disulfide oxidoreductase YuxK
LSRPIVLYDGVCGLCNRLVQFLLRRDREDRLRFASLQSEFSEPILRRHHANPQDLDTVYVVIDYGGQHERLLARSDAVLELYRCLGGVWRMIAAAARIIPRPLRDAIYKLVARNRYRLFGKSDSCMLPQPEYRAKFLDVGV